MSKPIIPMNEEELKRLRAYSELAFPADIANLMNRSVLEIRNLREQLTTPYAQALATEILQTVAKTVRRMRTADEEFERSWPIACTEQWYAMRRESLEARSDVDALLAAILDTPSHRCVAE